MGNMILFLSCMLCGAIFIGLGIYAAKKKTPMNFWSGVDVPRESISDIPAYNRAMGRLWGGYSAVWFISGVAGLWQPVAATVLMCVLGSGGAVALVLIYKRIEKKYRVK
ncbi:hypothetical protein D7X94_14315 [Acutalibacter sp. 1XD8-33]|uniref:hypothetical protein n=1 Tax=Acutalibacter sp. 1XD8-33 TaxID=2320081 RepID=UPI000EA134BA|nr:hypothetical protein [Acutalibacter sp. 1XD8-33]RKJ38913.1 hypothetical protein D7X94_14315 [Acutalibacter sp. 1XD8-33]